MSGAVQDTATQGPAGAWAPSFCCLQGLVARHLGQGLSDNPYPRLSPQARCWRHGYDSERRRRSAERAVTRGTLSGPWWLRGAGAAPGRGRARAGDRSAWSARDIALLIFAHADLPRAAIAEMVGRSPTSVSCQLSRLRKDGTLPRE